MPVLPNFCWADLLKTEPIMGSSSGLTVVVTEENEVSWWGGQEADTSISL